MLLRGDQHSGLGSVVVSAHQLVLFLCSNVCHPFGEMRRAGVQGRTRGGATAKGGAPGVRSLEVLVDLYGRKSESRG